MLLLAWIVIGISWIVIGGQFNWDGQDADGALRVTADGFSPRRTFLSGFLERWRRNDGGNVWS